MRFKKSILLSLGTCLHSSSLIKTPIRKGQSPATDNNSEYINLVPT